MKHSICSAFLAVATMMASLPTSSKAAEISDTAPSWDTLEPYVTYYEQNDMEVFLSANDFQQIFSARGHSAEKERPFQYQLYLNKDENHWLLLEMTHDVQVGWGYEHFDTPHYRLAAHGSYFENNLNRDMTYIKKSIYSHDLCPNIEYPTNFYMNSLPVFMGLNQADNEGNEIIRIFRQMDGNYSDPSIGYVVSENADKACHIKSPTIDNRVAERHFN